MDDANVSQEQQPVDPAASTADVASPAADADLRMKRIMEYLNDSLALTNAMQASLGAANCDLLDLAYRLKQAIDEQLGPGPAPLAAFVEVMPAIEVFLKLMKQADRYSDLNLKVRKHSVESLPALPLPSP